MCLDDFVSILDYSFSGLRHFYVTLRRNKNHIDY